MADNLTHINQHFNRITQTLDGGSRSASITFTVATEDVKLLKTQVVEVIEKGELLAVERNEQIRKLTIEVCQLKEQVKEKITHVKGLQWENREMRHVKHKMALRQEKLEDEVRDLREANEKLEQTVKDGKFAKDLMDRHFWDCETLQTMWHKKNAKERAEAAAKVKKEEDELMFEEDDGFREDEVAL